jgi:hypothetical protein
MVAVLRGRLWRGLPVLGLVMVATAGAPRVHAASTPSYVYFDQTEELDFWSTDMQPYAGLATQQVVKPWDPNGQMCLLPDGSGRFTSGYNPTGVDQKSPDGKIQNQGVLQPRKQPPVGVAIYNPDGTFTGQAMYVPGPYKMTPASSQWTQYGVVGPDAGGDIPPDTNNGPFNNEGTYTGCVFDKRGNFFAVDLGTAQGSYPPPANGRLIEWFKDSGYKGVCIVYGPDTGGNVWPDGTSTHHVDGSGGLQQPGIMAADKDGNILLPVDAADSTTLKPQGEVVKFDETKLPATEADCPTTVKGAADGNQTSYHVVTPTPFIDTASDGMPFPAAIAWDPKCACWAVDNVLFGTFAVAWFDTTGSPVGQQTHAPIASAYATPTPSPTAPTGQFSPFGMAFDAQGDLFVVDIHVAVDAVGTITGQSFSAGPVDGQGRLLEYTFTGPAANPPTVIASGENFPVAVTVCDPSAYANCPLAANATVVPELPRAALAPLAGLALLAVGLAPPLMARRRRLRMPTTG